MERVPLAGLNQGLWIESCPAMLRSFPARPKNAVLPPEDASCADPLRIVSFHLSCSSGSRLPRAFIPLNIALKTL